MRVFDPDRLDVAMNGIEICRNGAAGEDRAKVDLTGRQIHIRVDLNAGAHTATIWTNDLSHAYVEENSAYSSVSRDESGTGEGGRPRRRAAVAAALPRQDRRDQVRRQRDDQPELQATFAEDVMFLRYAGLGQ